MSGKTRTVVLPTIRVGGVEYVRREHFDLAKHAATNNMQCVIAMQKDRDAWKTKYISLAASRGRRTR